MLLTLWIPPPDNCRLNHCVYISILHKYDHIIMYIHVIYALIGHRSFPDWAAFVWPLCPQYFQIKKQCFLTNPLIIDAVMLAKLV